ncbi:MAG: tyrosine--tRNA ligase [Candidatus Paceibacterota bacterium]
MFFNKKFEVVTDESKIDVLLSRSISTILPSKEDLKKEFMSGRRLKIYIGADATGPDLHLGHATNFFFLERMRQLGHEIVILFGDFTAMIGDPSDKDATRVRLSREEVEENIKTWKKQISKVLKVDDKKNPVTFEKNSKWLSTLTFEKVVDLASNFTVQQMIERDMFDKRIKEGKPVYVHEFMYPLMVGYDSVVLDVDIELGGNDQTFNMLAGRTLQKNLTGKNKFVVATTLLQNPVTGKKLMSKSEGGYVSLQDDSKNMYGKIMALPDEVIKSLFIDGTWLSDEEILDLDKLISENPKEAKMRLAREIVAIYHDKKAAEDAEKNWVETFSKGGVPEDLQILKAKDNQGLIDVLVENKIVESRGEFRRLIDGGGIKKADGTQIKDPNALVENETYKIGKRRFVKIEILS